MGRHPGKRRNEGEAPPLRRYYLHHLPPTKSQRTANDHLERQVAHHETRPLLPWPASKQHPPPPTEPPIMKTSLDSHSNAHRAWLQPPIPSEDTYIQYRVTDMPVWLPETIPPTSITRLQILQTRTTTNETKDQTTPTHLAHGDAYRERPPSGFFFFFFILFILLASLRLMA